jgi:hypothetical protein
LAATVVALAAAALALRLKKGKPAIYAHGLGHIASHRFHDAKHELLPTNDLLKSWPKSR